MMRSGKRRMKFDVNGIRVNCPCFDELWPRSVEVWPFDGSHDRSSHLTEGKSTVIGNSEKSESYLLKYFPGPKSPHPTPS